MKPSSKVYTSGKTYGIECEIGSLEIQTHELHGSDGRTAYRSRDGFLPVVAPKEKFRSERYKELEYDFIATNSCRETAQRLNRIRLQETGAKATSVRNQAEREGVEIDNAKHIKAAAACIANGFDETGHKLLDTSIDFSESKIKIVDNGEITAKAEELGISMPTEKYEAVGEAVNISIDEVCCKRQASSRPKETGADEPKQVRNTVIHIQKGTANYIVVGETISAAMTLLMGFLLSNGLLGKYPIVFFADGAKTIKLAVEEHFGFVTYKYILDWPHLVKKTGELLSSAIKGKDKRNEIHERLKYLLWRGDVTEAIAFLSALDTKWVKSSDWLESLAAYLFRNQACIPCYALRKKLGLRNSSNLGEKSNDLVVSSRQKHNGMAWSEDGSFGLASICVAQINGEMNPWLHSHSLPFAFDSSKAA